MYLGCTQCSVRSSRTESSMCLWMIIVRAGCAYAPYIRTNVPSVLPESPAGGDRSWFAGTGRPGRADVVGHIPDMLCWCSVYISPKLEILDIYLRDKETGQHQPLPTPAQPPNHPRCWVQPASQPSVDSVDTQWSTCNPFLSFPDERDPRGSIPPPLLRIHLHSRDRDRDCVSRVPTSPNCRPKGKGRLRSSWQSVLCVGGVRCILRYVVSAYERRETESGMEPERMHAEYVGG